MVSLLKKCLLTLLHANSSLDKAYFKTCTHFFHMSQNLKELAQGRSKKHEEISV